MEDIDAFYSTVGKKIRQGRIARKITQEELGASVNLTRTSIINIEKGRQRMLLHTLVAIAETLRTDTSSLFPDRKESVTDRLDQMLDARPATEQAFVRDAIRSATKRKSRS